MDFYVGQKVVCVDDDWPKNLAFYCPSSEPVCPVKVGKIYTIRECLNGGLEVRLVEIMRSPCTHPCHHDHPFRATRFRPVEYKAMEVFRKIAADPSRKLEDA